MTSLVLPSPIRSGARVALVSPSGPIARPEDLERASENVRSFGWEPVEGRYAGEKKKYLAGTDEQRLSDLNAALRDARIDAVWCVRGGYGAMRLLENIDYGALRDNPRPIIGFSDITALHSAIQLRCDIVSRCEGR